MSITPSTVQELIDSQDFGDRIKGINQLRLLEPSIAFRMIVPLVKDQNTRVRYAAVSQLDPLGKQDLEATLELLLDRIHHDPEIDVQAAAADVIGGLKLTQAFEDLSQLYYQTSEWLIQLSIIATLGELGDPRGLELLEAALSSDSDLLKTAAISSLGELGDKKGLALLLPMVDDPDWQIRYRLVQALASLGKEESKAVLEKLAADPVEAIATAAQEVLATA